MGTGGVLGILVSLATVSRYRPKRNPDHDQRQRWKTFLRNHKDGIAAMDLVVVRNERHLRRLLREYVDYNNANRGHTQFRNSPMGRRTEYRPSPKAEIVGIPRGGGLHHRCERQEQRDPPSSYCGDAGRGAWGVAD
jgi:hypothetical protein